MLAKAEELYVIEAEIRGEPAADRRGVRQVRSRPIVEALHTCLQDHIGRVSAVSDLAEATRYAFRHCPGLTVFLDDGRVETDTNVVERAIRPNTLTRKNALFPGNDGGASHRATAMTLIQTAKLNDVNPMAYWPMRWNASSQAGQSGTNCARCCRGTGSPAPPPPSTVKPPKQSAAVPIVTQI